MNKKFDVLLNDEIMNLGLAISQKESELSQTPFSSDNRLQVAKELEYLQIRYDLSIIKHQVKINESKINDLVSDYDKLDNNLKDIGKVLKSIKNQI